MFIIRLKTSGSQISLGCIRMPRWLVEHTHPQDPLPENQSWDMGPDMKLWSTDPSRGNTALDAGEMTKALTNHFV